MMICRLGDLRGEAGNAFAIIANLRRQAKQQKMPMSDWDVIQADMMTGDYEHLLDVVRSNFDWQDEDDFDSWDDDEDSEYVDDDDYSWKFGANRDYPGMNGFQL